ncbi:DUF5667 domain-containing protein [Peribacillus deserti]|uniref:DUF5667 domain-containing protein n=1 Tax=Peribacillus deserti TaxID=673318 RepID=A0A2N5M3R9_9BACI|nr:DUF5667 domain-containing protein [Peribacillus deserti]PLT28982.1 hypothetical protein CUU66_15960 [Peribacillus deserti]
MQKKSAKNVRNTQKLAKAALALVLTSSIGLSGTLVHADEKNGQSREFETVDLQKINANHVAETENVQQKDEETGLLPGDFFYFTKIALEKIKLALTVNNEKEAELLSRYAAKRLAEAEALFAEGEQAKAIKTIKKAIEDMENSDELIDKEKDAVQVKPEEKTENKAGTADAEKMETKVDQTTGSYKESETLPQNIIALKAALDKVENPTAKAALQKNIDKTYDRLAEKLKKLEAVNKKTEKKETEGQQDVAAAKTAGTAMEPVTQSEKTTPAAPVPQVQTVDKEKLAIKPSKPVKPTKTAKPAAPVKAKSNVNTAKQQVKVEAKAVKAEFKAKQKAARQEYKQLKQELKQKQKAVKQTAPKHIKENKGQGKQK